jgi:hypothetical protein
VGLRRTALDLLRLQAADAARLGATFALLPPLHDPSAAARTCFAEACGMLAEYAAGRMVRLCLGHAAGSALPGAATALALLERIPAASLLLDGGECHRAGEDLTSLLRESSGRVGCVLLDSGREDLADRLRAAGYTGPLVFRLPPGDAGGD